MELRAFLGLFRVHAVDGVHARQGVVLAAVASVAVALAAPAHLDLAGDRVTGAQVEAADQVVVDVHVGRAGVVAGGADEGGVVVHDVEDAGDVLQLVLVVALVLAVVVLLLVAVPVPAAAVAAVAASPAAVGAAVVVLLLVAPVVAGALLPVLPVLPALVRLVVAGVLGAEVLPGVVPLLGVVALAVLLLILLVAVAVPGTIAAGAAGGRTRFIAVLAVAGAGLLAVVLAVPVVLGRRLLLAGLALLLVLLRVGGVRLGPCLRGVLGRVLGLLGRRLLFGGASGDGTGLDGGDQLALAEAGNPLQAHARSHLAQLRQLELSEVLLGVGSCHIVRLGHGCPFNCVPAM